MADYSSTGSSEGRSAFLLAKTLMISMLERGCLDGEELRRIGDDIATAEFDKGNRADAEVARQLVDAVEDSYAVHPAGNGVQDCSASDRVGDGRGSVSGNG